MEENNEKESKKRTKTIILWMVIILVLFLTLKLFSKSWCHSALAADNSLVEHCHTFFEYLHEH